MASACSLLGPWVPPQPRTWPRRHDGCPSLQQGALRSSGRRPAWRPPAPLRALARACPSAPAAPSHWPARPAGPAPIYNGVYQHFLKGAALRLNHTAASGTRRPARPLARGASSHWPRGESIRSCPPPIGSRACQSLPPPRGALPRSWLAELPLSAPPASSRPWANRRPNEGERRALIGWAAPAGVGCAPDICSRRPSTPLREALLVRRALW